MKTIFTIIGVAIVAVIVFLAVGGDTADAPTDTATSTDSSATTTMNEEVEDGEYTVDEEESTVTWEAEKSLVDGYQDSGFLPVDSGSMVVESGVISDGSITFNMAGVTATETSNTSVGVDRLTGHLRSDDFFAVEEHPTASFTVTDVAAADGEMMYDVTGELTLKGETNEVTFPAEVGQTTTGDLMITGSTVIDRTRWEVRYGSDSFFDNLGDNIISDEVTVTFDLVAAVTN